MIPAKTKVWLGFGTLVLLVVALFVMRDAYQSGAPTQAQAPMDIGGEFTLTDTHGKPFNTASLAGTPRLLFFGFTHCPDVCPVGLQFLSSLLGDLGTDANKVKVLFVTVDPARDTPQVMANYMKNFDARIVGLTGSDAEIKNVLNLFKAYAEPEGAMVNHSSYIYLLDGNGKVLSLFTTERDSISDVAKAVRQAL